MEYHGIAPIIMEYLKYLVTMNKSVTKVSE